MIDRTHPAVLAGARGYYFDDDETDPESVEALNHPGPREAVHLPDIARTITAALPHLTADDLPAHLVRDIQARTLRATARAATYEEDGIPWDHDWDRATVAAWLDELADNIEETP